ncbi:MAG TPA: cation:proton antiporter [Myxococcota bacterium]|nr:cation:proton antiporter [Myxococcota bacterium]
MILLLVFSLALLAAVLVSELASRSVLSTSVLFLVAGFLAGPGVLGVIDIGAGDPGAQTIAELALFSVLFTDGMRIGLGELRQAWRLPGRALLLGMPLTFVGTTLLARVLIGLPWIESALLGAVLTPTDPVFAAAVVGREDVPRRLRRLLNVESGLNDGLALPVVVFLIAYGGGAGGQEMGGLLGEVALGVAVGVTIPWAALRLERLAVFASARNYEPLLAGSIALLLYSVTALTHANPFLAAFVGGVTVASVGEKARADFRPVGEVAAELLKLAALLVFGALLSPRFFAEARGVEWVFAFLALFLVRPVSVAVALVGSELARMERLAAAWFGPKGFASVVYALLILRAGTPHAAEIYHVSAMVIAASIVAHSSTDVVIARRFRKAEAAEVGPQGARSTP